MVNIFNDTWSGSITFDVKENASKEWIFLWFLCGYTQVKVQQFFFLQLQKLLMVK